VNAPIRRVSTFVALLFATLLISTTWIQFVQAKSLNAREDNRRTLLSTYARERGQILAGDTVLAESVPVDNEFKFLRRYPQGEVYADVTGYYSFYGASGGIESTENALLSGRSDKLFYRRVSDLFTGRRAQGANVVLTINPKAQQAAWDALGDQRGAAVALNPKTGEILAMVSKPGYDPNALASHDLKAVDTAYKSLNGDPARPLVNRAIGGNLYPPGSTFKVVTAAAALSTGKWTETSEIPGPANLDLPQTTVGLPNSGGRACGPGDKVTLQDAMRISCNTAFGWLGLEMGGDTLREQAGRFGFGDQLSIPMRVTPSKVPAELNPPQTAQAAVGQYDVRVTPLEMAMVAGGIANKGVVMKPHLVQSILASDLTTIDTESQSTLTEAVSPQVAAQLTSMMELVVSNGTGTAAQMSGVRVAGKTGTAQHAPGAAPHAWFISFAPADNPSIAVAVVVEEGGTAGNEASGGQTAAPISKAIMEAVLR
jgi:peptidoglycan glycosyltransferase